MNEAEPPRTKSLLEDFSEIRDSRQPCKVMYRLSEVLLLVVCGTMAACDDYDDIVLWGKKHLNFLRGLQEYHHGIPCADWLRVVMNRIDPELFASCFLNFAGERLPGAVGQIAIACPREGGGQPENRRHLVSQRVDGMSGKQRYPDEPRFKGLTTIAMIETRIEVGGEIKTERRCYISSRVLTAKAFAGAARAPWAIENGLHWVLDVEFKEDQSRLRRGHGAKNMARVRHLALNLIRAAPGKTSIKGKRKLATWDTSYLLSALSLNLR